MQAAQMAALDELWRGSDAADYGLTQGEFNEILLKAAAKQNWGLAAGTMAAPAQQAAWLRALKANDLVLARVCAQGHERAWEHFVAIYHEPLVRAAVAITGNDTVGRDLAGSLYAELYGMKEKDGERRCPLNGYRGKGSLMGWLRTTLAQRHVDHYRRSYRERPLDDGEGGDARFEPVAQEIVVTESAAELAPLAKAVTEALEQCAAEDRFVMAANYLDGRKLLQIAQVLGVHEATVSRRVRRIADDLRKQVLRCLQRNGLSRRAAEEALGADPRDMDFDVKKLLQYSQAGPFKDRTETKDGTAEKKAAKETSFEETSG
jgi:RNA polymerase sigma-70 factor (ECF subfamily)